MTEHELELSVGETVQIGDYMVTLIDIEDGEASFRIDPIDSLDCTVSVREAATRPMK